MQIYMAPLEGITGFVFRNAFHKYYGGVDRYFTPFITPHTKKNMDARERRDILPENNRGITLVPQVLTCQVEEMISISRELQELGYTQINLNLGCPSGTVAAKGKGSGFLGDPIKLDRFFEVYFENSDMPLSIKTRVGVEDLEEFEQLLAIYKKYPFCEVIIHPRLGKEFYRGMVHRDLFSEAVTVLPQPVCYNGDIFTTGDFQTVSGENPECERYMLGRGLLWNPQLAEEIVSGSMTEFDLVRFGQFHDEIVSGYREYISGDRNVLFRMKELWGYWKDLFPDDKKHLKKIRKASTLMEYGQEVRMLFEDTKA